MTAVLDEENATRLARRALARFGADPAAPLTFVKLRENCVFRVEGAAGSLALRLHRPGYRTEDEIAAESDFMLALAADGLPVVEPLRADTGEYTVTVRGEGMEVVVDAQRWVESSGQLGTVEEAFAGTSGLTGDDFEQLGELAARLHDAAEHLAGSRTFLRAPWDAQGLVGAAPLWGDPCGIRDLASADERLLTAARAIIVERLEAYGTASSVYGAIHADFTPENVLRSGGGLTVIDFDDFGDGWYLFDLATALFFFLPHARYADYRAALLRGYRARRALSARDEEILEILLTARGMTYLGWASTRAETETAEFIAAEVVPIVVARARELVESAPQGAR